jgi:GR25 family glycosyltransferase involved in LPS biosynthesis
MAAARRGFILHLDSATERTALVESLKASFFLPLTVLPASTGEDWLGKAEISKRHVRPGQTVTQGMLGCAHSHIDLLYRSLKGSMDELYVFEDDCQLTGPPGALEGWVDAMRATGIPWDVLLLGANEYVESERGVLSPSQEGAGEAAGPQIAVQRVARFWGTHAMVVRPRGAQAALKVFADAQKQGVFLPADWMWNEAVRQGGLLVFGPPEPTAFCRQAPGLVSAITGTVRLGLI